jgi:nitrogen fixation NifU-like protein
LNELRELYQEVILDHSKSPRNLREIEGASHRAEGFNPLCGDRATIFLDLDGDRVLDASFVGRGCSISTASASMMTDAVRGKTLREIDEIFERFHDMVTAPKDEAEARAVPELGKLAAFSGVSEFPVRVKCASLAWHTLKAALAAKGAPVSTE